MNKRILFVSAVLAAMTMSATLTSCVKDEVSSAVAADRDQHLQDKKDQATIANATTYSSLLSSLKTYKSDLVTLTQSLEDAKATLAKLQSGVEPLTAYWNNQVAEKQTALDAAKKKLETLQNLKGLDGDALTEEWTKANEAYDAAYEVYKANELAATVQRESLELMQAELEEIPAVEWAMRVDESGTKKLDEMELDGTKYSNLKAELDGVDTPLFKVANLYNRSTQFDGVEDGVYYNFVKQWYWSSPTSAHIYDYQLVSVQNQKIAETIYKKYEETTIKGAEDILGKATDEADATGSLYAQLAQAKKDLEAATTDLEKLHKAEDVKTKQDAIDEKIIEISDLKKSLEELKTTVAEVSKGVPQEFYEAYIKDVVAYDKAKKESDEAWNAVAQAEAVKDALSSITSQATGWGSIDDAINNAKENITYCEAALLTAKENQANLKGAYGVTTDFSNYADAIKTQQNNIERYTSNIASCNSSIAVIEKLLAILASKL